MYSVYPIDCIYPIDTKHASKQEPPRAFRRHSMGPEETATKTLVLTYYHMLCHAVLCHAMPDQTMPCHAMCDVIPDRTIPYCTTDRSQTKETQNEAKKIRT